MSAAFGWTVEEVEHHVVSLIQAGQIQGRVDSQNKASCSILVFQFSVRYAEAVFCQILRAKKTDYRAELFARAMKAGEELHNANRKLLLRMRLYVPSLFCFYPVLMSLCSFKATSGSGSEGAQRSASDTSERDDPAGLRVSDRGNLLLHIIHVVLFHENDATNDRTSCPPSKL
jgi:hypothetical protein